MQLSRGESLEDTGQVLSRYLDAVAIRTLSHAELEAWAEVATIPVINALTEVEHPCQALADALTIRERLGRPRRRPGRVGGRRHERARLAGATSQSLVGMEVVAACPEGYEPPVGTPVRVVRDPREAARGADVLVTDIWVRLGQEATRAAAAARPGAVPARRGARRARIAERDRPPLPARPPRRGDHPRTRSTGRARRSGTRRRTASTSRKRCSRCSSASAPLLVFHIPDGVTPSAAAAPRSAR